MEGLGEPARAHIEDSLAMAEHLSRADLQERLDALAERHRPGALLHRAWLRYEYALCTPETEGDEELFTAARTDLETLTQQPGATLRNPNVFNGRLALAYAPAFRARARHEPITDDVRTGVIRQLGSTLYDLLQDVHFRGPSGIGRIAELVAAQSLLRGKKYFPYPAAPREESNGDISDNHDFYVLSPNGDRKAPISVKHIGAEEDEASKHVLITLRVGRLACNAAKNVPHYADPTKTYTTNPRDATRTLAYIMAREAGGVAIAKHENSLLRGMTGNCENKVTGFFEISPERALEKSLGALRSFNQQRGRS